MTSTQATELTILVYTVSSFFLVMYLYLYILINICSLSSKTVYTVIMVAKFRSQVEEYWNIITIDLEEVWLLAINPGIEAQLSDWKDVEKWQNMFWDIHEIIVFLYRDIFGRQYMERRVHRSWAAMNMDSNRYALLFGSLQLSLLDYAPVSFHKTTFVLILSLHKAIALLYSNQEAGTSWPKLG